jgi:hypothetical protein
MKNATVISKSRLFCGVKRVRLSAASSKSTLHPDHWQYPARNQSAGLSSLLVDCDLSQLAGSGRSPDWLKMKNANAPVL